MLPALHDEALRSKAAGALIVFGSDGRDSRPYFADTPHAAARRWLKDNESSAREETIGGSTAAYVFMPPVAAPTAWYSLRTLALEVVKEDEIAASLHALEAETTRLTLQAESLAESHKALTEQVGRLEAFGIDMTRLAVVHQALIDGHQEQLVAFRESLESTQAAARIQATSLADGQKEAAAALQTIISRLAGIEEQLKRF